MVSWARLRRWRSLACYAALAAFASSAGAIQSNGVVDFDFTTPQQVIWQPPTPSKAAVRVTTSTGMVMVRAVDGEIHSLGVVPQGMASIFEGPFRSVKLVPAGSIPATGESEVYEPTDDALPARLLGSGVLQLTAQRNSFSPYGCYTASGGFAEETRLLVVVPGASVEPVTLTAVLADESPAGTPYIIEGGDWGFCSRHIHKYTLTSTSTVQFRVFDPIPTCAALSGIARAQSPQDEDEVSVDGSKSLEITLTNLGVGDVTLTYDDGNGAQSVTIHSPTGPAPKETTQSGRLSLFKWRYLQPGGQVKISIKGS